MKVEYNVCDILECNNKVYDKGLINLNFQMIRIDMTITPVDLKTVCVVPSIEKGEPKLINDRIDICRSCYERVQKSRRYIEQRIYYKKELISSISINPQYRTKENIDYVIIDKENDK